MTREREFWKELIFLFLDAQRLHFFVFSLYFVIIVLSLYPHCILSLLCCLSFIFIEQKREIRDFYDTPSYFAVKPVSKRDLSDPCTFDFHIGGLV